MTDKIEIFISASDDDEELRDKLEIYLGSLTRQELASIWHIGMLSPGQEKQSGINSHLRSAHIILLLITPSFIDSYPCYQIEMVQAMARHNAKEARVIPIILSPVDWREAPFGKLQPLPTNGKPITTWSNRDKAFLNIVEGIRKVVDELRTTSLIEFELLRNEYFKHLRHSNEYLEFTGLPLSSFDLNEDRVLFEPLFVMPQLKYGRRGYSQRTVSITDAIIHNKCCLLLGDLGSGKTALLQYLALIFAKDEGKDKLGITTKFLPLLISLPDYLSKQSLAREKVKFSSTNEEANQPFFSYLYMCFDQVGLHLPEGFFWHYLSRGECLILLDGLDEVLKFFDKNEVREIIFKFADFVEDKFPNNRIVITARLSDHDAIHDDIQLYMDRYNYFFLPPFTHSQIADFVKIWYSLREQSSLKIRGKVQNLLSTLVNPRVLSLATNPLSLTIIALIHSHRGVLPNRRVELYDQVAEVMLMRDKWKGLPDEFGEVHEGEIHEYKKVLLEHIAFWLQSQPEESTHTELHQKIAHFLKKEGFSAKEARTMATNFLNWSVKRGNLLTIREDKIYRFKHSTFQEYFIASNIYRNYIESGKRISTVEEFVITHLYDPLWNQAILFFVSLLRRKDATQIIRTVLKGAEYHYLYPRNLLMALRFLAEDISISSTMQDLILKDIWQKCFFWENPAVSWSSGQWRKFCQDIQSILPEIRGSSCEDKVFDKLLETLLDERSIARGMAIEWLGELSCPEERVVTALIEAFEDKDPSVRDRARFALSKLGQDYEEVAEKLEKITKDESQSLYRRTQAARALMHLSRAHSHTLKVALLRLSDLRDKHIVKEWVYCIGQEKTNDGQIRSELVENLEPILVRALRSNSPLVRSQVAWIVGKLRCLSEPILIALKEILEDEDQNVRESVRRVLVRLEG